MSHGGKPETETDTQQAEECVQRCTDEHVSWNSKKAWIKYPGTESNCGPDSPLTFILCSTDWTEWRAAFPSKKTKTKHWSKLSASMNYLHAQCIAEGQHGWWKKEDHYIMNTSFNTSSQGQTFSNLNWSYISLFNSLGTSSAGVA